ncbi:MAG: sigma-70 factor domain-containing protein, partial [Thermodesulfobacteriota bacterium]
MKIKKKDEYHFEAEGGDSIADPLLSDSFEEEEKEDFSEVVDYEEGYDQSDKSGETISPATDLDANGQSLSEYDLIRYYLHEIAGHSLLSREEEIQIAKEIEIGKMIVAKAIL